jgi:hypothetical protein
MMGMGYARNMYSDLQEIIKYCKKVSSRWNFLKLIHNARNDKHKTLSVILKAASAVDISLPKPVCCLYVGVGLIYCTYLSG